MVRTICISTIFLVFGLIPSASSATGDLKVNNAQIESSIAIAFGTKSLRASNTPVVPCAADSPCDLSKNNEPFGTYTKDMDRAAVVGLVPIPFLGVVAIGLLLLISLLPTGRMERRSSR